MRKVPEEALELLICSLPHYRLNCCVSKSKNRYFSLDQHNKCTHITMKSKKTKENIMIGCEELAALTLLKKSGVGLVEAAQVAYSVIARLRQKGRSAHYEIACVEVVEEGIKVIEMRERTVPFAEAARLSIEARAGRRPTTLRDLRHFTSRMLRVEGVGERPLRAMGVDECRNLLQKAFGSSAHSYRKGRAVLHSIFAYGKRRGWCAGNPVDDIETPSVSENEIVPLTLQQIRKLEDTATKTEHADMRLSLHLLTYCGLRPAEVARLSPQDIRWKEGEVVVRPVVSKTGGGRVVPLYCKGKLRGVRRIIPRNWTVRWKKLRRAAGLRTWQADALRHTFATYHATYFRNLPELQLEMGHSSPNLLRTRYVNAMHVTRHEASAFFGVR